MMPSITKKTLWPVLLYLVIISVLSACQPTPESEIVINKNDGALEAALETEKEYDPMAVVYPLHWEAEYEELGGKLTADIDADVIAQQKAYNVVKIKPYLVPIDQADKIIKALYGTTDVYNYDPYEYTKGQIETLIIEMKAEKAKALRSGDEADASEIEKTINDFLILYETAPDSIDAQPYDHMFTDTSEYDIVRESIVVKRDIDDFYEPFLSIINTMQDMFIECPESCIVYTDRHYSGQTYTYIGETSILGQGFKKEVFATEEAKAAIETVGAFLREIGAEDRMLQHIVAYTADEGSDTIAGYRLSYGIQYDGTVMPFCVQLGVYEELMGEDSIFHEPYIFEMLEVEIENGEIVGFQWSNIFDTGDIIKENVALMPFEEIMKNIENQLTAKYAYLETFGETGSIYVDQIILTYAVEAVKDHPGEYMLVPAWAFYGGNDYGDGFESLNGTIMKGRHAASCSLLTINAIDGTVIHVQ